MVVDIDRVYTHTLPYTRLGRLLENSRARGITRAWSHSCRFLCLSLDFLGLCRVPSCACCLARGLCLSLLLLLWAGGEAYSLGLVLHIKASVSISSFRGQSGVLRHLAQYKVESYVGL